MTNNGIPDCAQGKWSAKRNYKVTFSNPRVVKYCSGTIETSALVFTSTTLWGDGAAKPNSLPMFKGPCLMPTTSTTTPAPQTSTQGTIGPTSGGVEWICSNGSGSGGKGSAAIAAVQDGQGNWQCPSDLFANLWSVEVGGAFYCTTDDANGNDVGGPPYYAPTIGKFTVRGEPGSYYGVYCTEPGEDALDATP
jgi:hypothetical protein